MKWLRLFIIVFVLHPQMIYANEEVKSISPRKGMQQDFLLIRPAGRPVATVILFAGSGGNIHVKDREPNWGNGNFLVRNRNRFADEGLVVAVIDAPSDHSGGMEGFRSSKDHALDVAAVIGELRKEFGVPVWLVGTSRGTISAANAAARIKEHGPNGLVLTSSVTMGYRGSIYDVPLDKIQVPTLIIHNKSDGCPASPFTDGQRLQKYLSHASVVEFKAFDGGEGGGDVCQGNSFHGFQGLDETVVKFITNWIKTHS